ncbi:hypothetical protein [Roseicyclus sp.]|uniref:hypothetical protein n=1 Tax=Roseicyclus sp. TaxID=1914329 RepID=UPI003F6AA1B2
MLRRPFLALAIASVSLTGQAGLAQSAPPSMQAQTTPQDAVPASELRALLAAMGLYDILAIMAAEGRDSAPDLEADMFPGQGGAAWMATVASIYATDKMTAAFEAALPVALLSDAHIAALRGFFESDLGARIAAGETAARQAFLDPEVEQIATDLAEDRAAQNHPRIAQLTEFNLVNDLVERNVSGALNSNFAFFRGLSDGGAFAAPIPEEMMLAQVWGQEPEIRAETVQWLFAYQTLAYEDLSDADLQAYIDLSRSDAGRAINASLFAAFDTVFNAISHDLGRAAAGFMAGEDT